MKRATLLALIVTPIVGAAAGVMIGRATNANADVSQPCAEPTVYIDMADGVSIVTGGPDSVANCDGPSCQVSGAEEVEVRADDRVQCVSVNEGQTLSLTQRSDGLSLIFE